MMNADCYPSSQDKLWYTITRVSGKAKDQVLPYCIDNTVNLTNLSAFKNLMNNAFRDSDWQGTAQITIQWLCQWNQDFSTYLAEFNCHVRYTQWNEKVKKSALLTEISDELHQLLITVNTTELNLESLTCTLQSIDNCHQAAQQVTRNNTHSWVTISQSRIFATITALIVPQSVHSFTFITAQWATAPAVGEDSMNLSVLQSQRRGPLSAAEKAHCMQNNLCLYCEGESHKAVICTVKPSLQMQLRQIFFSTQQSEIVKELKNK